MATAVFGRWGHTLYLTEPAGAVAIPLGKNELVPALYLQGVKLREAVNRCTKPGLTRRYIRRRCQGGTGRN